ncbi:hypothetical protein VZT92_018684 [Zoarces viviparus]|uniref:Ciliary neurotrophic factor n=1 Tax=Zoarces viviparus TaxID=48416 RepID=A0AAW1EJA2_ZOAVI
MDYKLNGSLRHYVLALMLLEVQWRPVFPAPTPANTNWDLDSTKLLTSLLILEANELLEEYMGFHGPVDVSVPDDVPDSSMSGVTIIEKLQDIYIKGVLFYLHISKVEEYQKGSWSDSKSVLGPLSRVKGNLVNHVAKIKTMLINIDSLPTTPAPPQWSHDLDYAKRVYGGGVIVALKDWLPQVLQALAEASKVSDK